ncbi:alpha/beta hydrolase [Microbacterium sp. zg.Y625]|uniref:alpha/beta fold hydrolase n=1 Tax=Microbacterium jiangjiandongii TaxID=3049071 RepID=UPI00214C838E|nr:MULTISPECIES: alpha/beta hydrolase [unclassified Microbacterium]MCR2793818.1 alpha/beta hydrolase [Microbacterium sp. zg.Y625]MCR2816103.1 alpha/beta hydrolase [Microbacterium sp. zg.Y843]WIM26158.1 alpha/beta hydrolase [Microbacterium sp. zg-Y625]
MGEVRTALGDRVVFDRYGPESAPAVIFVAGAGLARAGDEVTSDTARRIGEAGFQAIVHDRVGRGDSAAPGPISLERELEAIRALAQHLDVPLVLVGHSSGCAIVIEAAPSIGRLTGLVLWEAPFGQFDGGAAAWWERVEGDIDAGRLEDAVAAYMVDMPPGWIEYLKGSPEYPAFILSWIPDGSALALVESRGLASSLRDIMAPVLAVYGTESFPGMARAAVDIAAAAPRGSHEQVRGAGHTWDSEAMAARLVQLLATSEHASRGPE